MPRKGQRLKTRKPAAVKPAGPARRGVDPLAASALLRYDPGGSYQGGLGGSGDIFAYEAADLSAYLNYQLSTGSDVATFTFNTTPQQEAQIMQNADNLGGASPGFCADHASQVLKGVGPFSSLTHTYFPGSLANQLLGIPGVMPSYATPGYKP